jgi:hypothetical protein
MSEKVNNATIKGKVVKVCEPFEKGDFSKQEIWVETGGKYSQTIPVGFVNDKRNYISDLKKSESVTCLCDVRGRIWNDRCFGEFQCWRIDIEGKQQEFNETKAQEKPSATIQDEDDDYEDEILF